MEHNAHVVAYWHRYWENVTRYAEAVKASLALQPTTAGPPLVVVLWP